MRIKISINSIEDLREARDLLDGILAKETAPAKKAPAKKAEPAPVKDPEPDAKEEPLTPEEILSVGESKQAVDETSVKVMLADKIKAGKKAEIRALFTEYGVTKLSELIAQHPDKLAEFAAKAEAIS